MLSWILIVGSLKKYSTETCRSTLTNYPDPSQPVFVLTSQCFMPSWEATNTNFIVFGFTWPWSHCNNSDFRRRFSNQVLHVLNIYMIVYLPPLLTPVPTSFVYEVELTENHWKIKHSSPYYIRYFITYVICLKNIFKMNKFQINCIQTWILKHCTTNMTRGVAYL